LTNISFVDADVVNFTAETQFDAIVGRLVLQFLPDPVTVLRTLVTWLKPGGVMVFHEANWSSFLAQAAHLPLRMACAELVFETFRRGGAHTNMELVLYRAFAQIGLPTPELRLETPVGNDPETRRWVYDLYCTARARFIQLGLSDESVGDIVTLSERLEAELDATDSYAACIGLIGAWSRKASASQTQDGLGSAR
jgi:SAM-dependent methyltransferase